MRAGIAAIALSAALAASCAGTGVARCPQHQSPALSDVLYFGTARPGGTVTSQDWAHFLAEVVTPRFPQGLTTWNAGGQWRAADGTIVREGAYVLTLVHPEGSEERAAIEAIASEYKARFRQEAVLRVTTPACMSY